MIKTILSLYIHTYNRRHSDWKVFYLKKILVEAVSEGADRNVLLAPFARLGVQVVRVQLYHNSFL